MVRIAEESEQSNQSTSAKSDKLGELIDEVESLSLEQLRELNDHVVDTIKSKKKLKKKRLMKKFSEGEKVKVKDEDIVGEIIRKKRTKVIVESEEDGFNYDVPVMMLEKYEEDDQ